MNGKEMNEIQLEELKKAMELTIEQTTMQGMMQAMEPILAPIMAAFQKQDVEIQELRAEVKLLREQPPVPTKTRISLYEASKLLGKAVATIRTLGQSGTIPSHKVGNHRIYYKEELIEWMHGTPANKEKKQAAPIEIPKRSDGPLHPKDRLAPTLTQRGRRSKPVHI